MVLAELDGASSGIPTSVSSIAVSVLVGIAGISSRVTDSFSRSRGMLVTYGRSARMSGESDIVSKFHLYDPGLEPQRPPAAAIPGALEATEHALTEMTDAVRFERLALICLQDLDPSLRPTGGPGDRQRDAVGGRLFEDERLVMTISLEETWAQKVVSDLKGLVAKPPTPERVVAVTNRKTGARRRNELERDSPKDFGVRLRVVDRGFLALRLLRRDLLPHRENFLGLPMPAPPVALEPESYERNLASAGSAVDALYGRDVELAGLLKHLEESGTCALEGPGGVGKTRLALEAASRVSARMLFLDDRSQLTATVLPAELAGADHLVLVVDNAHRRDDLRELVGLLHQRTGQTNIIMIARPGFRGRLTDAVEGSALGPLRAEAIIGLGSLAASTIGEIVRNAKPALSYPGAVDRAIAVAEGNPLIALLAHSVAVKGGALDQFGRDEILAEHARSLVASLSVRVDGRAEREILELLAITAALTYLDLEETDIVETVAGMLDTSATAVRRRLHDFADAGLVTQHAERFALTPDILSGHILWSSFFAERPAVGLAYQRLWDGLADGHVGRLCNALGGLPAQAVERDHPIARYVAEQLTARARSDPSAIELTRAVAPALPSLAASVVDVALEHLPTDTGARARALVAATEALARTPEFSEAWPRQLAVAQAVFAGPQGDESEPAEAARKKISEELTRIYSRVPLGVGPQEGEILAVVQHEMARTTRQFWRRHCDESGAAEATAIAARQLLAVTFDNHYSSAEDERKIHLQGCVLPASQWTSEVLMAGARLFSETLERLDPALQLEQVGAAGNLVRAARGFDGPFGTNVGPETAAQAREAEADLVGRLRERAGQLPIVTRAALEDQFSETWPDDAKLHEFHLLFSSRAGRRRRDAWETEGRDARADELSAGLLACDDPAAIIDRWSDWLVEVGQAGSRDLGGWVLSRALELTAKSDSARIHPILDNLLAEPGPMVGHLAPALAATYVESPQSKARAERALGSEHELVRGVAVRAVGWSSLPDRGELVGTMVTDGALGVRRAVVHALRVGTRFDEPQLELAVEACLPDDVETLGGLVHQVERARAGQAAQLTDEQAARAAQIVRAAATRDRLEGHGLRNIIKSLAAQQPRLAIDFCRARVAHQLADDRERDLYAIMRVDPLPDELRCLVRGAATDDDVRWVLDQIEASDPSNSAHGTLRDLQEWLDDDGGAIVTERLATWLQSDDDRLRYEARQLLDHPIAADAFRERARELLQAAPSGDLEDAIISARHPQVWSGTRHRYWRSLRDEFAGWTDDCDEDLADVGRSAVAYYERLLEREEEPEESGDDGDQTGSREA